MVAKWPFLKLEISFFFLPKLKHTFVKTIRELCNRFLSNWNLNTFRPSKCLNFVNNIYVFGQKWPEMIVKWQNTKNCPFHFESESR